MKKVLTTLMTLFVLSMSIFTLNACGVEFKVNFVVDGVVYATIDTNGQEIIRMPENPTKEDYAFDGWYWDKDTWQTPFTANSLLNAPLSSDMNVYCKWKANVVNGDNNSGDNSIIDVSSIDLNYSSIYLEIDDTLNLTATIYPNNATDKSVSWSSSNTSVTTVSNGLVTAKSAGTATITVKTSNNKTATCYVTVNNSSQQLIPVTSISLNKTSATLEIGDTLNLTATVLPNNATEKGVNWSSSNTSVATVSHGTITAKAVGTTTITVKTNNNITATCYVTVNLATILPTNIFLNKTSIELEEGQIFNLVATVLPSNSTNNSIEWISLDSSVITVNNGKLCAISEGETNIIATTTNGLSATCSVKVTSPFVFVEYATGYALKQYKGTDNEVVVPSMYKGKPVLKIGDYEPYASNFNNGFANCASVTNVVLPQTITTIDREAFSNCTSLKYIIIPNSVTNMGYHVFLGCSELEIICCESSFQPANWNYNWNYSNIATFFGCNYVVNERTIYGIYKGVATVVKQMRGAFTANILSSINYNEKDYAVTSISYNAFYNYYTLKSVVIPNSVTRIGSEAFKNCNSLTNITIPNSVTEIEWDAFYDCDSLTSVVFEENSKLIKIRKEAFKNCSSLTNIVIPNSVTSIEWDAFKSCTSLVSVVFEGNSQLTDIGKEAFKDCSLLTNIIIPNSVTSIGQNAFYGCDLLTIYCEVESRPQGWDYYWNNGCPVVWGYKIKN